MLEFSFALDPCDIDPARLIYKWRKWEPRLSTLYMFFISEMGFHRIPVEVDQ